MKRSLLLQISLIFAFVFTLFIGGMFYVYQLEKDKNLFVLKKQRDSLVNSFDTIVDLRSLTLENFVADYSLWNDMIKFSQKVDPHWGQVNIDASMATFKLSHIWVFNKNGDEVYTAKVEKHPSHPLPSLDIKKNIQNFFTEKWRSHYFATGPEGAIYEIRGAWLQQEDDTQRTTPAMGYYFASKEWDEAYVQEYGKMIRGEVLLAKQNENCSVPNDHALIAFSKPLLGIDNKPVGTLCVEVRDTFLQRAEAYSQKSFLLFSVFASISLLILIASLIYFVIRPIGKIGSAFLDGETSELVHLTTGKNEIGTLAKLVVDYQKAIKEKETLQNQIFQTGKIASLGVLGAGVAHELNTPLTVILGYSDFLLKSAQNNSLPVDMIESTSEKIKGNAERMKGIIDHIREFSREEKSGKMILENINNLTDKALMLIRGRVANNGIGLIENYGAGIPNVMCDRIKIETAIQDLVINAKDALDEMKDTRGKTIIVTTQYNENTKFVLITVEDNANGIPASIQNQIFDPFFTTKPVGSGTGLGLTLIQTIAREHGGRVRFTTEAGKGTTFILSILAQGIKG